MEQDELLKLTKEIGAVVWEFFLHMLWRATWVGFLAFVLAVIVLIYAGRKRLFKRSQKLWNVCAKLHYPAWALVITFTGCAAGATSALHSQVNAKLDEHAAPLLATQLPTIRKFLTEELDVRAPDEPVSVEEATQQFMRKLYYEPESDGFLETTKARCINWFTLNFGKWVISAAIGAIVAYAIGRTGETLGLDDSTVEFTVDTIKEMDFSRVDQNIVQIALDAVKSQISSVFMGLYAHIALYAGIAASPLVLELLLYHLWWKRRRAARSGDSSTTPPALA